jgi:polyhydroxyalkanoate synthase subunit PhaC
VSDDFDDLEGFELEDLWGGELLGGVDPLAMFDGLRKVTRPTAVARGAVSVLGELARIAVGRSKVEPAPKDPRFAHPAWAENPLYHRLAQSYLAWGSAMQHIVDEADIDWRSRQRAQFAMNLIVSAAAPTNNLATNPAALVRAFESGGRSVLSGTKNWAVDMLTNRGMPQSVDTRPFRVGETVALSAGSVVLRDDLFELIQYQPTTPDVYERPIVLIPPQINRFWFMDMAPGRSLVEYALAHGIQLFVVSWQNPTPEQGTWGLDTYAGAVGRAVATAREITGADSASTIALCAGGITTASYLGHLAASGDDSVSSASFAVTMLDFSEPTSVGMLGTTAIVSSARRSSSRTGVLEGHQLGALFAALRPDDMIWRYWINNYLMGNDPPAFDLLAWNADTTRLPAALHADFLGVLLNNTLATPHELKVLGSPIDLGAIDIDTFVVGAEADHLTPWRACYASTQLFGGESTFVLSSSGHVQSLVNPPGNPKMNYRTGPEPDANPDEWLAAATPHPGSWWEPWAEWVVTRLGETRKAPTKLGSRAHPPLSPAPGTYVHAR